MNNMMRFWDTKMHYAYIQYSVMNTLQNDNINNKKNKRQPIIKLLSLLPNHLFLHPHLFHNTLNRYVQYTLPCIPSLVSFCIVTHNLSCSNQIKSAMNELLFIFLFPISFTSSCYWWRYCWLLLQSPFVRLYIILAKQSMKLPNWHDKLSKMLVIIHDNKSDDHDTQYFWRAWYYIDTGGWIDTTQYGR